MPKSESSTPPDYSIVTEFPGQPASAEQLARLYHRYRFARAYARNRAVLEMACGTGIGLGYLAEVAGSTVGIDIDRTNLAVAHAHYRDHPGVDVREMDVHRLDFADGAFDLLLLFEALYYLRQPERMVEETRRVLRAGGAFIIATVNPDWRDFHRSPHSHRYFSTPELAALLAPHFASVELYGAFPASSGGAAAALIGALKWTAVRLNLIPGSLKARAYLKRIFHGPLHPLPAQVRDAMGAYTAPAEIASDVQETRYKILYAVARL